MLDWIRSQWRKEWPEMKDAPLAFIICAVVAFGLGIFVTAIAYEHLLIANKSIQIETLKTENDSFQRQKDEVVKEKENLVSQINDLQNTLVATKKQNEESQKKISELEKTLQDTPKQVFATPESLMSPILQNMTIRICDLTRENFIINDKTFENCHIYGPAVIAFQGCVLRDNGFTEVDANGLFIETLNDVVSGTVVFDKCVIRDCRFHKVGIIGNHKEIELFKGSFGLK